MHCRLIILSYDQNSKLEEGCSMSGDGTTSEIESYMCAVASLKAVKLK